MMLEIHVSATSAAPPERVHELLADVTTWPRWAAFDAAELEGSKRGEGETRRFRRGRYTTRERVTRLDPGRLLAYELLDGIPVKDYNAQVVLDPTSDGGTRITWHSTFRSKIPATGRLIRKGLSDFIADAAQGLARYAERHETGARR